MSPIGRVKSPGTAFDVGFTRRLYVGSGYSRLRNVFPTIAEALAYIDTLSPGEEPSEDRKFIIELAQEEFDEKELSIPDWVWVKGQGLDNTIIRPTSGGSIILANGVGGIEDLTIATLETFVVLFATRDNSSVYSLTKESFDGLDGLTLDLTWVFGGGSTTVTFQAGDNTAQEVATRIMLADPYLVATDSLGYVRIAKEVTVKSTGTANAIFGWSTVSDTEPPLATLIERRFIHNVSVIGVEVLGYGVVLEDVSQDATYFDGLRLTVFNGSGFLFNGGDVTFKDCDIFATDYGIDSQNPIGVGTKNVTLEGGRVRAGGGIGEAVRLRDDTNLILRAGVEINPDNINNTGSGEVIARATALGIRVANENGYFAATPIKVPLDPVIEQMAIEMRHVWIPAYLGTTAGISVANLAPDGELGGFRTKVFTNVKDRTAAYEVHLPNVAAIGDKDVFLILDMAPTTGAAADEVAQFLVKGKYISLGGTLTNPDDEDLSEEFDVAHSPAMRQSVSIQLDNDKLDGNAWLRFEITRDVAFTPSGIKTLFTGTIHLIGLDVRL